MQNEKDDNLNETAAADTLRPGAGSGGTSKVEMLQTFTQLLAQLGKEDLSHFLNDSLAKYNPDAIPNNAAEKNRASIMAKEDVDALFASDDLTEEFKEKASTIFEAAVNTAVIQETARLEEEFEEFAAELEEEFEEKLEEEAKEIFEDLSSKIDQYLSYVVENWMEENELALETSMRAEVAESFIAGLHNLFTEHHITVPENKLDIVAEMKAELDATKSKLNEAIDLNTKLEKVISEAVKESTLAVVSEGLAETQVEKLRELSEGIEAADDETYKKKLEIIKENYFNKKPKASSTGILNEEIGGVEGNVVKEIPANMAVYADAIKKSLK